MSRETDDPFAAIPEHMKNNIPADVKQKIVENQTLQAAICELSDLYALLKQDVSELHEFGSQSESGQAWRRSSYRAVFSWIEGVVYQMKQIALQTQGGYYQASFSRAEIAFLREESYYLDEKGKVKVRYNNFAKINRNLRFAYLKFVEGFGLLTKLEVDRQGWEKFLEAIKIRNRLTHPKCVDDLVVTDENMEVLIETINWFDAQISKLIDDAMATVIPTLERIRGEGKENIQSIVNNAMSVFEKAGKVESVIAILDELVAGNSEISEIENKLGVARRELNILKKEIVSDLI
ncbi:MAG TPA: hypothetical protein ENK32_10890 [Anaerolineae bacterium]|nr:hypothetical protein [Anaerolineae bacterium]